MLAVGYLRHFEKVDEYVYLDMYVEKIMNVYISLYSSVWNKRLDDNIYSMLTWDPGLEIHRMSYFCMSELKWFDLLLLFGNYKWWRYISMISTVFSSDPREPFCEEIKQCVFALFIISVVHILQYLSNLKTDSWKFGH